MPFTSFVLSLHRSGGIANVDLTLELRWEGEAGTVTVRRSSGGQSATAEVGRVRALWDQIEALEFWERRVPPLASLGRLGRFFFGPAATDAMRTTVSASAVVDGRPRSAGLSVASPPEGDDARALEALRAIDRFFSGRDSAD